MIFSFVVKDYPTYPTSYLHQKVISAIKVIVKVILLIYRSMYSVYFVTISNVWSVVYFFIQNVG